MDGAWRELMKTDAQGALLKLLKECGVCYTLIDHAEGGKTSEMAAKASGEELGGIVKSMLLKDGRSGYLGIIVGGDRRIDLRKAREAAKASSKLGFARPEEVKAALGFEVGEVPPFAFYMSGIAAIVDSRIMERERVVGAGGSEFRGIRFSPKEFEKFGYAVGDVAESPR